ncbi:MAG: metallophosphoesterase, partial [Myxococcota bacterium]
MKSLVLAHLSDLHISRFGGGITQMRGLARAAQEKGWEPVRQDAGWSIDVWRAEQSTFRRLDWLRLVDDAGVVQREVKLRDRPEQEVVDELLELMEFRIRVSAATLAKGLPGMNQVAWLLDKDPTNVNVRFCAVAHQLRADNPDWVLITGDLTDDGDGYDLLLEGLAPFVESGRLVCIPGNHDIYA